jgi:hypothetical protein
MSHFQSNNRTPDERRKTTKRLSDSDSIEVKEKNSRTNRDKNKYQGK